MAISKHATVVDVPADFALAVAGDVTQWKRFMSALKEVRVVAKDNISVTAELTEDIGAEGFKSVYRVFVSSSGRVFSHQIEGKLASMDVEWALDDAGGKTLVNVTHEFRSGWFMIGGLVDKMVISPFFLSKIVPRTLENFKKFVEERYAEHGQFHRGQGRLGEGL